MENWIKVSLLGILSASAIIPYILVPLGLSSLTIGNMIIFSEIIGVAIINHIINIKNKKKRKHNMQKILRIEE